MGDAQVEGAAQDGALFFERLVVPEVVPQSQRDGGQFQPAAAHAAVGHRLVTVLGSKISHASIMPSRAGVAGDLRPDGKLAATSQASHDLGGGLRLRRRRRRAGRGRRQLPDDGGAEGGVDATLREAGSASGEPVGRQQQLP